MIITLISFGAIVIGIILKIIYKNVDFKSYKVSNFIDNTSFAFILPGVIFSFIVSMLLTVNTINYDIDYQNMLYNKEILEYRIDHMNENVTGNEMLYNDIVEFNNGLRSVKKWANNPWFSWFNNENVATIDYIELNSN